MKHNFIAQSVFLVTIKYSLGIDFIGSLNFSMERYIYIDDYQYYFSTVHVLNVGDCAKLCHSVTSCKVGNYESRGHFCHLKHVLGDRKYWIGSRTNPDYISWTRNATEQVFTVDNSPCENISSDESYIVNYVTGTCKSYACGKPRMGSSFSTLGKVFTTNGKILTWTCYNHEIDVILPPQAITCTDDARWEGLDDNIAGLSHNCTYTKHNMSDGSAFTYKVVDIRANQTTAFRKCRKDSANLTTILTLEKLEFYRGILVSSTEDYWVDVERINRTEWQTSFGKTQPMGNDIWERYDDNFNQLCARMKRSRQYKLDDNDCSNQGYSYICERRIK